MIHRLTWEEVEDSMILIKSIVFHSIEEFRNVKFHTRMGRAFRRLRVRLDKLECYSGTSRLSEPMCMFC